MYFNFCEMVCHTLWSRARHLDNYWRDLLHPNDLMTRLILTGIKTPDWHEVVSFNCDKN